jgi:cytochrome b
MQGGKMRPMAQPVRRPTGPPKPRIPLLLMRVWDGPTRLFHWAIVLLVVTSYLAVQVDWMQVHYWSGYTMLTLLLFRLVWGFIGSETSRFRNFLRSPVAGLAHVAAFGKREPDREIGHNAAGGWMVLVMLLALAVQASTGLFAGDPIEGGGPFVDQVAGPTQKLLNRVHHINFNIILGLIALHILAILVYAAVKRQDLVRPMVTGKKRLPANMRQPRFANPLLAVLIVAAAAICVWALVRFA